jgi:nucleotide-binding universal stress UspA family protein
MLRHFRRFPPDLIVLATHQREGLDRWLHKAVAEPLARRSGAMVTLKRILIPIDHVPRSQTALRRAFLLARGLDCAAGEFRLIHVGNPGTAPRIRLTEQAGWSYEIIVRLGDVVDQILEEEAHWRPDLMVLATQGHMDFLDALRGSTTERVLRGAHCPVLAVPARTLSRNADP